MLEVSDLKQNLSYLWQGLDQVILECVEVTNTKMITDRTVKVADGWWPSEKPSNEFFVLKLSVVVFKNYGSYKFNHTGDNWIHNKDVEYLQVFLV